MGFLDARRGRSLSGCIKPWKKVETSMASEPMRDPLADWARHETVPEIVDIVLTTRLLKSA
jgi:hypothetical protein